MASGTPATAMEFREARTSDSDMTEPRFLLDRTIRRALRCALPAAWVAAAVFAVTLPRQANATPITSAANAPNSGISPGGVDMATGEIIVVCRPDLFIDGPVPLIFSRYYASMLAREGLASGRLGPNWLGTYDWKLNVVGTTADVISSTGMDARFTQAPEGGPWIFFAHGGPQHQLIQSGSTFRFLDAALRRVLTFSGSLLQLTQITDEHGNSLSLTYTGPTLTQVSDGLGHALTFTYDPFAGMLASVSDGTRIVNYSFTGGLLTGYSDPGGQHWTFQYVAGTPMQGLLTNVGEPAGNVPVIYGYDTQGRVVSQNDAAGGVGTYSWDAPSGNTYTDPLAHVWTYQHDAQNNLVSFTDPNSQPWMRAYDASSRLVSETRPLGDVTNYSYDAASGYPASVGFADGSAFHWTYGPHLINGGTFYDYASIQFPDGTNEAFTRDAAGNPTSITDRSGFHWQASYNTRGQVLSSTNPAGGVSTFAFGAGGMPVSATDPAGNITRYAYDGFSRLISLAPDGTSSRTWTYDALDHVTGAMDERGKTWSFIYDANGRMTGATDPLGEAQHYAYDGLDRFTQSIDPLGNATLYAYDANGRMASITDGTHQVTRYSYNVWGDLAGMSDPASDSWVYSYDANRRVTQAQDPNGHSTLFTYDNVDRPTHLSDPLGNSFDYAYDGMGRMLTASGPLGFSRTYGYEARGLLNSERNSASEYDYARNSLGGISQFTDPNRSGTPYAYDTGGRLNFSSDPLGHTSSYSYDGHDRLIHVTTPVNTTNFMYDAADRLLGVSINDGTTLAYAYDDANRLTGTNGGAFAYDAAGRMTSSNGLSFAYDAAGRMISETYGPTQVVSYIYDARGNLSQVNDWMGGVTTFTYDAAGNLIGLLRPNRIQSTYAYDGCERLVNVLDGDPDKPIPVSSISITRDALEQPTAVERSAPLLPAVQTPGTTNFSYDSASQVIGPTWDGLGRMIGDGSRTLVWDGASRLRSYTAPSESQNFSYDAFGNLLSRTQGSISEQYEWNYANSSPTLDVVMNGPTPMRYFIHTPSGLLLESIEASGGARRFYHYDENGGTNFLTDDTGAVVAEYAYGPYGEVHSSGATANNPFTLGGDVGVIQLGGSGLFAISGGGIYDATFGRTISGGAINSGLNFGLGNGGSSNVDFGSGGSNNVGFGDLGRSESNNTGFNSPFNSGFNSPLNSPPNNGVGDSGLPSNGIPVNLDPNNGVPSNALPDHAVLTPTSVWTPLTAFPDNGRISSDVTLGMHSPNGWHSESSGSYGDGVDAYIWFDDVSGSGETKDTHYGVGHKTAAFEIKDWSFDVTNHSTIGSATGGAGAGKIKFNEFTIKKPVDASTPEFFKNCCAGSHYKNVTISLRKAGGENSGRPYLVYKFGTVFTTKIDWSSSGDKGPTETITFAYGKLNVEYKPQGGGPTNLDARYATKSVGVVKPPCLSCPY